MNTSDKVNILLVDDTSRNLQALEALLEGMNETLVTARSGQQALKCCLEREFAVILLDVQMPGMDGFETASMIRQREKSLHTPIIFLTAFSKDEQDVYRGYALGAVDYIFKPIVPEILRTKVTVFVNLYKRTREVEQARHLEELNISLKRSNQLLEQFAYAVSHDLQEPLRQVSNFVELLAERYGDDLDEEGRQWVDYTLDGAARMSHMISDLLTYSRVQNASHPFAIVAADEALDGALENLRTAAEETSAVIKRSPLPTIKGDKSQLIQLFQNLVGNALKFHRPGTPPCIHIGAERDSQREDGLVWTFFVRDNGIGIAPESAQRIFELFQRLDTHKAYPGNGMGLALCKSIVEHHGGNLWVEAAPEQGSTFYFSLIGGPP